MNEDDKLEIRCAFAGSLLAEQLIACLEGEIAKRDEELAACRVAVENCEVFRARIGEMQERFDSSAHRTSLIGRLEIENAQLSAELAAIKAQEPLTVEFMQFMTAVVTGAGLLSRGKQSKGLASKLSATAYKYMLGAQVSGYQQKPIGYRCWFNREPKNIMVEWGKSLPSDMNPSATYQALYAAPVSEANAQGVVMPQSPHWPADDSHLSDYDRGHLQGRCDMRSEVIRLNAAPVQQVSVPDVSAMARILADRNADACNVNREDNWAIYGQDYIDDVKAMLAAAPAAPAADAGLVEALEHARLFIVNGIDLGFIQMPEAGTPDPAHETLPMIDAALATHRAKGLA